MPPSAPAWRSPTRCAGNAVACAGIGVGSHESAALVLSRLPARAVRDLLIVAGPTWTSDELAHLMVDRCRARRAATAT